MLATVLPIAAEGGLAISLGAFVHGGKLAVVPRRVGARNALGLCGIVFRIIRDLALERCLTVCLALGLARAGQATSWALVTGIGLVVALVRGHVHAGVVTCLLVSALSRVITRGTDLTLEILGVTLPLAQLLASVDACRAIWSTLARDAGQRTLIVWRSCADVALDTFACLELTQAEPSSGRETRHSAHPSTHHHRRLR
jgi:hypothetical protein